jgi:hypothetical protein
MDNQEILNELESLYKAFRDNGNINKAAEVMQQIVAIQTKNESGKEPDQTILLG